MSFPTAVALTAQFYFSAAGIALGSTSEAGRETEQIGGRFWREVALGQERHKD